MAVNRCHTADRVEFRRRLLSCDVFQDFLNDIWSCHIRDDAQPTAAVRADRQIDCVRSQSERNADCDAISRILCAVAPSSSCPLSIAALKLGRAWSGPSVQSAWCPLPGSPKFIVPRHSLDTLSPLFLPSWTVLSMVVFHVTGY